MTAKTIQTNMRRNVKAICAPLRPRCVIVVSFGAPVEQAPEPAGRFGSAASNYSPTARTFDGIIQGMATSTYTASPLPEASNFL